MPHSQTLVIWAYHSHITLAIWVRVRVTGDARITRVLGNGDAQNAGMPILLWQHHFKNEGNWDELTFAKTSGTVTKDVEKNLANS